MKKFIIHQSENSLTIQRNQAAALLDFLFTFFLFSLLAIIPFLNIFVYHYAVGSNAFMLAVIYLIALPFLIKQIRFMKKQIFVFDRIHGKLVLNGREISTIASITSVRLEHDHIGNGRMPINRSELYLRTTGGEYVQIEGRSTGGTSYHELKEVGTTIADYLNINSNVS